MTSVSSNRLSVLAFVLIAGLLVCGGGSLFCPMGPPTAGAATPIPPADSHHPIGNGGECLESLTSSPEQIAPFDPVVLPDVDQTRLTWVLEHAGSYPLLIENKTNHAAPLLFLLLSTFRL